MLLFFFLLLLLRFFFGSFLLLVFLVLLGCLFLVVLSFLGDSFEWFCWFSLFDVYDSCLAFFFLYFDPCFCFFVVYLVCGHYALVNCCATAAAMASIIAQPYTCVGSSPLSVRNPASIAVLMSAAAILSLVFSVSSIVTSMRKNTMMIAVPNT